MAWILAALLFVDLGPVFQNASAHAEAAGGDLLSVDIQVEVGRTDFTTVVVHFIDPGDDQQTVALINRGGAFYGGQAKVERANLVVVFEGVTADRSSVQSEPTDLISLGVDEDLLVSPGESVPESSGEQGTPVWVWLALAVVAGFLSVMAFWATKDYPASEEHQTLP